MNLPNMVVSCRYGIPALCAILDVMESNRSHSIAEGIAKGQEKSESPLEAWANISRRLHDLEVKGLVIDKKMHLLPEDDLRRIAWSNESDKFVNIRDIWQDSWDTNAMPEPEILTNLHAMETEMRKFVD